MDEFDFDAGPPEFQRLRLLSQAMFFLSGLGWLINYILSIRTAFRDRTAGVPLIPLCNNIAWEFTYAIIYCPPDCVSRIMLRAWLIFNILVLYATVKNTNYAKPYSLFLPQYTPIFTFIGICFFFSAHCVFTAHVGGIKATYWSGMVALVMMNGGALNMLIQRGHTRGTTYGKWLSRAIGSIFTVVGVYLRAYSWPEKWGWSNNIVMAWLASSSILLDIAYGICFWFTRQAERARNKAKNG